MICLGLITIVKILQSKDFDKVLTSTNIKFQIVNQFNLVKS